MTPQDFAEGVRVTPTGTDSVQRLELPPALYKTVTRADLGDLRMFNAAGEAVPYALVESDAPVLEELELPLYPVTGETLEETLSVQIERGATGTSLQLDTTDSVASSTSYIIDQRQVDAPRQLRLKWAQTEPFVSEVRLEASGDLNNWRVSGTGTLAELRQNGFELVKNELDTQPADYLWLKPAAGEALPPLSRAYAEVYHDPQQQGREVQIEAQPQETGYLYDLGGAFRVVQVAGYELSDVLAQVQLESSSNLDGPWTSRYQGVYFDLTQNGQRLQNTLDISEARARYWRLTTDPENGLGNAPTLTFTTVPDTLAFVARGEAPFTLAYGSLAAAPAPADLNRLPQSATSAPFATLSEPFELAGEAVLREEASATFPWQSVLLWAVLLGGVGLLGILALNLLKQGSGQSS